MTCTAGAWRVLGAAALHVGSLMGSAVAMTTASSGCVPIGEPVPWWRDRWYQVYVDEEVAFSVLKIVAGRCSDPESGYESEGHVTWQGEFYSWEEATCTVELTLLGGASCRKLISLGVDRIDDPPETTVMYTQKDFGPGGECAP